MSRNIKYLLTSIFISFLAFACFNSKPLAQNQRICIRNSDGNLVLRRKCSKGFKPASLANINKDNTDSISNLSGNVSTLSTNVSNLNSKIDNGLVNRFESLPPGKTITGIFGIDVHSTATLGDWRTFVNFPAKGSKSLTNGDLKIRVTENVDNDCGGQSCIFANVADNGTFCTGTVDNPTASPGKLCLYISALSSSRISAESVAPALVSTAPQITKDGFYLSFNASASGDLFINGTWAYTEPVPSP